MERNNNHVINDEPIRETTIILQLTLLHVNQSNDVDGTILNVSLNSTLKHSFIIEVPNKDQVYKMMLISKLNIYYVGNLSLDMLRYVRYKNTNPNTYMHDDNQMHVGLFDDVGLLFDEGKGKLI